MQTREITCDEFRRTLHTDPADATRAKRFAMQRHFTRCGTCRAWAEEAEAIGRQRLTAEQIGQADNKADLLAFGDLFGSDSFA